MSPESLNPVFVVGVFRSGTSLLYSLLNQHPEMALMYECDVWDFPENFLKVRFQRNWLERQEFYNHTLSRHRLTFGGSLRGLEQVRTPEDLYRSYSDGKGAKFFGEKSPFYCTRLQQLARRHPGCSFILLWREPAEIYRSMILAGRKAPYFRRRGMLSRLIYYQEQMIKQAARLKKDGARVHELTYEDLTEKTETVCRGICEFLKVEYDEKMLDLTQADFSAVHTGPHHEHLRRGVIARRRLDEESIDPGIMEKLTRFRNRWKRIGSWQNKSQNGKLESEPSAREYVCDCLKGAFFCEMDKVKRALFEFLPLEWLRTYRHTKKWFTVRQKALPADRLSLRKQFSENWPTIIASFVLLAGIGVVHSMCDPRLIFIQFYIIPCAILTLIINGRWGALAAAIAAVMGPFVQGHTDSAFAHSGVLFWNCTMRFLLLGVIVLLLDRVRVEVTSTSSSSNS